MSNPGVIKLASENIGSHKVWLDDNIGESIHLHIDEFRLDFTFEKFIKFSDELKDIVNEMVDIDDVDLTKWEGRFLFQISESLLRIDKVKKKTVKLSELSVRDDDGRKCMLTDCSRVKALNGELDINDTVHRKTNFWNQDNKKRLFDCLEFVKENGYPINERYIIVQGNDNYILDGWHRAACLFKLYGDIDVEVQEIIYKGEEQNLGIWYFPTYKVKRHSKIVLYGAGNVGKRYFEQLKKMDDYELVGWTDQRYKEIGMIDGFQINNLAEIKEIQFDYIVVANIKEDIRKEIKKHLVFAGIADEKIII